ncbi:ribonuclease H-like domain-containing protein [Gongronella butleri]|nr:ribonuclease H-like domain-containing protein [Gongronella butleri]
MLPSLGLFREIPCPSLPDCRREYCVFSHAPAANAKQPASTSIKRRVPGQDAASGASSSKKARGAGAAVKPAVAPTVLADLKAHTGVATRQLICSKLFEQFLRLYPVDIHGATVAGERTLAQEKQLLAASANPAGYKQQAMSALMQLKKRAPVTSPEDENDDNGEKEDEKHVLVQLLVRGDASVLLAPLLLTPEQRDKMGYPSSALLDATMPETAARGDKKVKCDRCKQMYEVKELLDARDVQACDYHHGKLHVANRGGDKLRIYSCCQEPLGSAGCLRGPHVYKDDDDAILHAKIPFKAVSGQKDTSGATKRHALLALDCEMGYTTLGMELIRVTVIDTHLEPILDELVLPTHMVVDLNSRYSGVATLAGAKHDLHSIRELILGMMDANTILVGHGLENDLRAMRIIHDRVIDTAALYPHPNGLPYRYGLRVLTTKYLKRFIQDNSDGHDSSEDASAALQLVSHYLKTQK